MGNSGNSNMAFNPDSASDSLNAFDCSICLKGQRNESAEKLCVSCNFYLCATCYRYHQYFPDLSGHRVVSKTSLLLPSDKVNALDITAPGDSQKCNIPGICVVKIEDESFILVSDWYNKAVKVLKDCAVISQQNMPFKPYGLFGLENTNEVVVTMRDCDKMAVLKLEKNGTLTYVNSFIVDKNCRGITGFKGPLKNCYTLALNNGGDKKFVEAAGCVSIYTYKVRNGEGVLLHKFNVDLPGGNNLFPRCIAIDPANEKLYVTDEATGVVVFDTEGKYLETLKDEKLRGARAICIDKDGNIYVGGMKSCNIVKFNSDGRFVGEIINQFHELKRPISLNIDDQRNILYVGSGCESKVHVAILS